MRTLVFVIGIMAAAQFCHGADDRQAGLNVIYTIPGQNDIRVASDVNIEVIFDDPLNAATINATTFKAYARRGPVVDGVFSFENGDRTLIFDPDPVFAAGEEVTVILTPGIESAAGDPLDNGFVWSFTVAVGTGGAFGPATEISAVGACEAVFTADLNNDGLIDLVTANGSSSNVSVLINNGSADFAEPLHLVTGARPLDVFAADLDADGDVDLATANNASNNVSVHLNNGNGFFSAQSQYPVGNEPRSVYATDLDGDGDFDLATANAADDSISILLNDGTGVFAPHTAYHIGDMPWSIHAGDLDNDGDMDIASANWGGSGWVRYIPNNGDGSFGAPVDAVYGGPTGVYPADLNGDRYLDMVVAGNGPSSFTIALNNGDGTFTEDTRYYGFWAMTICVGDFDADGNLDAASSHEYGGIGILPNHGNALMGKISEYSIPEGAESIATADLDNDGDLDLVTAHPGTGHISLTLNEPRPRVLATDPGAHAIGVAVDGDIHITFDQDMYEAVIDTASLVVEGGMSGLHVGTLEYDDASSLLTFSPDQSFSPGESVEVAVGSVLRSQSGIVAAPHVWTFTTAVVGGSGLFGTPSIFDTGTGAEAILTADLNGDGIADLVTNKVHGFDDNLTVLLGEGDGSFAAGVSYPTGPEPAQVCALDIEGDGDLDLAIACDEGSVIELRENEGDGTFSSGITRIGADLFHALHAADLNGDGLKDLVTTTQFSPVISVFINRSDGSFSFEEGIQYDFGDHVSLSIITADIDNDGDLDIATSSGNSVIVFHNHGDGFFAPYVEYSAYGSSGRICAADMNDDGDVDLAVAASATNSLTVLLSTGDGAFGTYTYYPAGNAPSGITATDLDADDDIDLIVPNRMSNVVSVFRNNGDGTYADRLEFATGDLPTDICAADFDGDGDIDLATPCQTDGVVAVLLNTDNMLSSITVTPTDQTIFEDETSQYAAEGMYLNGATADLTAVAAWSSTDTGIAQISDTGLATALAVGGPITIEAAFDTEVGGTTLTVAPIDTPPSGELPLQPGGALGNDLTLVVELTDDNSVDDATLFYRRGDRSTWNELSMQTTVAASPALGAATDGYADKAMWSAIIPADSLSATGLLFYVEATDDGGQTTVLPAGAPDTAANITITVTGHAPYTLAPQQYTMLCLPLQPGNNTPLAIFDELGAYDTANWKLGRYSPPANSYLQPPALQDLASGRGFWLVTRNAPTILLDGGSVRLDEDFEITLQRGFNQIGNPFAFPVSWSDVVKGASVQDYLYGWNGLGYDSVSHQTLQVGRGYWVYCDADTDNLLVPPLAATKSGTTGDTAVEDGTGWRINAVAAAGIYRDSGTRFGTRAGATIARDDFDYFDAPPPPGGFVDLSLLGSDDRRLLSDYRGLASDGECWTMLLASDQADEPFTIEFRPERALPPDWACIAIDAGNLRETDLLATGRLDGTIVGGGGGRSWRIIAGVEPYVDAHRRQAAEDFARSITRFRFHPAFPNPLSATSGTAFSLAAPHAVQARISIHDMRGRIVRTVFDGAVAQGLHPFGWEGRNDDGLRMAAGMYFIRIQAGEYTTTSKVVLLR